MFAEALHWQSFYISMHSASPAVVRNNQLFLHHSMGWYTNYHERDLNATLLHQLGSSFFHLSDPFSDTRLYLRFLHIYSD